MFLFYTPNIEENPSLSKEESKHCTKVLRKSIGDAIFSTDGRGNLFTLEILSVDKNGAQLKIINTETQTKKSQYIHIAIAPTKSTDRIEWFVEKATEFGIDEISFISTSRTERPRIKLDRIERIAVSAMKQSKEYFLPKINPLITLNEFLQNDISGDKYIAHVDIGGHTLELSKQAKPNTVNLVLIGPEGDFSEKEIKLALNKNFKPISLGPKVLRTETAGIAACHTLNLINY